MNADSLRVVESTTGDEILIKATQGRVTLAVREEMGDWWTVTLPPETVEQVVRALQEAARAAAS